MAKLLKILFWVSLLPYSSFSQIQETYTQIELSVDQFPALVNIDLFPDHFHKTKNGQVALLFDQSELAILRANNIPFNILIEDMERYYEAVLTNNASKRDNSCGLLNFDVGDLNGYHTYENMQSHINAMRETYPSLVKIMEIGQSVENRTIFAVKISDNVEEDEADSEGVVYYDALTHAREPMGLETTLYYMWWLLENYTSNPEAFYLVNNRELYFVPVVNPDGVVYNETTNPQGGGLWRKNRSANGECIGVDLNRNYSFAWGDPAGSSANVCSNTYHGANAFSEPETQAIRDFTLQIQPSAAFSSHTYSDVFLCPNGFNTELVNYETYAEFASEFSPPTYNGYGNWIQTIGYFGAGTTHDYLNEQGAIAYTPEIGHDFWESPDLICERVQEMLPAMKYMSWVAGSYACFHDFQLVDTNPIWEGEEIRLSIRVKNRGLSQIAPNVSVSVSTVHPALVAINTTSTIGDLDPRTKGDNADTPIRFSIQGPLTVGEEIALTVNVFQDNIQSYEDIIYIYAGEQQTLFSESGENGFTQWMNNLPSAPWDTTFMDAFNGEHCLADTRYGNYNTLSSSFIQMIDNVDLSETNQPWLEFNAKWSFEPNFDYARVVLSTDNGLSWTNLEGLHTTIIENQPGYTGTIHWVQERINLEAYQGMEQVKIGFTTTSDNSFLADGIYIDDLRIVDYIEPDMVAIDELSHSSSISIYPNPAVDQLNVVYNTPRPSTTQIKIVDLMGQVLLQQSIDFSSSREVIPINTSTLPDGIYYFHLNDVKQEHIRKIVIIRP